jgi:hypothetical protein
VSFLEEFSGLTFAVDRVIEFKGNASGVSDFIKNFQLFNQWKNSIAWQDSLFITPGVLSLESLG